MTATAARAEEPGLDAAISAAMVELQAGFFFVVVQGLEVKDQRHDR
jgi:hypothetical protein